MTQAGESDHVAHSFAMGCRQINRFLGQRYRFCWVARRRAGPRIRSFSAWSLASVLRSSKAFRTTRDSGAMSFANGSLEESKPFRV
jgi:hypothetical protein